MRMRYRALSLIMLVLVSVMFHLTAAANRRVVNANGEEIDLSKFGLAPQQRRKPVVPASGNKDNHEDYTKMNTSRSSGMPY